MSDAATKVRGFLGNPEVANDPWLQLQLVHVLAATWDGLPPTLQDEFLKGAIQSIGRCRSAASPHDAAILFKRILKLPEEDVIDALRYDQATLDNFPLTPDEMCYPPATMDSPSWMGRYIWWARPGNAPLAYHAWACISVLGTVAQRRIFLPAARRIWMNMYIMLGGVRGTGKGQAYDAALKLLGEVNRQVDEHPTWDDTTKRQRRLNVLPSDITGEAIITDIHSRVSVVHTDNEAPEEGEDGGILQRMGGVEQVADATGLIPLDEAAVFFGRDAWGIARKSATVTAMKESDRYHKRTKSGGLEELENLSLGMLACCAPDWMQGSIDRSLIGGGLMDRTMWIHREPNWERREMFSILDAPPRDPLYCQTLAQWCVERVLCQPVKMPAKLTPEAERALKSFYKMLLARERTDYEMFGADMTVTTGNRAFWATLQVATLLALAEDRFPPLTIEAKHVEMASGWVDAENQSMKLFLEEADRSRDQVTGKKMLMYLRGCGGCCQKGSFNQALRQLGSARELEVHIQDLVDQNLVERVIFKKAMYYRMVGHHCANCVPKEISE